MYHFNGPKYITQGIQAKLGLDLQLILWDMIQSMFDSRSPLAAGSDRAPS